MDGSVQNSRKGPDGDVMTSIRETFGEEFGQRSESRTVTVCANGWGNREATVRTMETLIHRPGVPQAIPVFVNRRDTFNDDSSFLANKWIIVAKNRTPDARVHHFSCFLLTLVLQ